MKTIEIYTASTNYTLTESDEFAEHLMRMWNEYSPDNKDSHFCFKFNNGWKGINLSLIVLICVKEQIEAN